MMIGNAVTAGIHFLLWTVQSTPHVLQAYCRLPWVPDQKYETSGIPYSVKDKCQGTPTANLLGYHAVSHLIVAQITHLDKTQLFQIHTENYFNQALMTPFRDSHRNCKQRTNYVGLTGLSLVPLSTCCEATTSKGTVFNRCALYIQPVKWKGTSPALQTSQAWMATAVL